MAVLLRELERALRPRWATWLWPAAAVSTVAAAVALGWPEGPPQCAPAEDALAGAWDPSVARRLREVVGPDARKWQLDALHRTEESLDAWADRWATQWATTCAADDPSALGHAMAAARRRCLQARREDVHALVGVLHSADEEAWALAPGAVADLHAPETCVDPGAVDGVEVVTCCHAAPSSRQTWQRSRSHPA
jgi:hypothetical protein